MRLGALGADATPRLSTYERPKRDGFVRLFADPRERVLVGAVAVGPQATEWLGQLTLAVRSATPVDVLLDTIQPYPTFSEAIFLALRELVDLLSPPDVRFAMLGEVLTAIVTPFHADGAVNVDRFQRARGHLVDNGSDGLVVAGTTGECPTLSDDEKLELFAAAVEAVGDRATVVAGTGTYDTRTPSHLTERRTSSASTASSSSRRTTTSRRSAAIVRALRGDRRGDRQADRRLQHPEPRRRRTSSRRRSRELAEIPNVRAVKQAHDDLDAGAPHRPETGLDLYAGDDNLMFPFLELGGVGGICVHTHVVGPADRRRWSAATRDGDVEGARAARRGAARPRTTC